MVEVSDRARQIAQEAMRHEGEARSKVIEEMAGGDQCMIDQVAAAVSELQEIENIRNQPTVQTPVPSVLTIDMPKSIGHFSIRRVIGSGGMGTVYEALQDNPRRKVAIKVMKRGVTSNSALRRFQFESQVLARLHHPGIAQVYEAGTWDDGTGGAPFFAMEFIAGAKPLTLFVTDKDLGSTEKINLFIQICDAVHHGHQKGIIHRDLKPGNVLVDRNGNPKVIDFGVARSTDSDLAVTTQQTDVGALVGTLQYMSPEQCEADPDIIDTRSDVYALGVMLYELLCGKTPYDLGSMPIYEAAKVVREQPATRLSVINPLLRGDLETIVSKAMAKDPDYRYQSALELRQDLERFSRGEPISARPLSLSYQLSLMVRRNKAAVLAAVTVAAILIIGTIVSVALAVKARSAEERALASQAVIEAELVKAATQQSFLEDVLSMTSPRNAQGRDLSMQEVLLEAAEGIEAKFIDHPELAAETRATIGEVMYELQMFGSADEQLRAATTLFERSDGVSDQRVLEAMSIRSRLLTELGRAEDADAVSADLIDRARDVLVDADPVMIEVLGARSLVLEFLTRTGEALEFSEQWVEASRSHYGEHHELTIEAVGVHGRLLIKHGALSQDEELQESLQRVGYDHLVEAAKAAQIHLGDRHPVTVQARAMKTYVDVFRVLTEKGSHEPDEFIDALEELKLVLGADHTVVLDYLHQYGRGLMFVGANVGDQGMLEIGRDFLEQAHAGYLRSVGADHPLFRAIEIDLEQAKGMITGVMKTQALRASYEHLLEIHDEDHHDVLRARALLAVGLLQDDQLEEGLPLMDQVTEQIARLVGPSHNQVLQLQLLSSNAMIQNNMSEEGVALAQDVLGRAEDDMDPGSQALYEMQLDVAKLYGIAGKNDFAYALMIEVVESVREHRGPTSLMRARALATLGHIQLRRGYAHEALDLISESAAGNVQRADPDPDQLVLVALLKADALLALNRSDEILPLQDEILATARESLDEALRVAKRMLALEQPRMIEALGPSLVEVLVDARQSTESDDLIGAEVIASIFAELGSIDEAIAWQERAMIEASPDDLEQLREMLNEYRSLPRDSKP